MNFEELQVSLAANPSFEKFALTTTDLFPGQTYRILSSVDGKLKLTEYNQRPCYGETRPYYKTHKEEVKDRVAMPGDLSIRFPDGNPVAYAVHIQNGPAKKVFTDFLFSSEESPYWSVFKNFSVVRSDDGLIRSLYSLDTRFDPTLLVNSLIYNRYVGDDKRFKALLDEGASGREAFILWQMIKNSGYAPSYYWTALSSIRRVLEADPVNLSGNAETFFERAVYNRPKNEYSFVDPDKKEKSIDDFLKTVKRSPALSTAKDLLAAFREFNKA